MWTSPPRLEIRGSESCVHVVALRAPVPLRGVPDADSAYLRMDRAEIYDATSLQPPLDAHPANVGSYRPGLLPSSQLADPPQCDLFRAEGVSLTLPPAWRDDIWQHLPATAVIDLDRFRDYVALDDYTYYRVRVRELEMRLQNFGATEVKRQSDYVQPTLPEWAKSGPLYRLRRPGNHVF